MTPEKLIERAKTYVVIDNNGVAVNLGYEIERLRSALIDIANPMAMFKRQADTAGAKLTSLAFFIGNNPEFLKKLAKEALEPQDG